MKFDLDTTLKKMILAVKDSIHQDSREAEEVTKIFLETNRNRYQKIIDFRLAGKIDEANFQSRLDDEQLMLEAQLNTLVILSKVKAQNAANAAFKVLEAAVKSCLKLV